MTHFKDIEISTILDFRHHFKERKKYERNRGNAQRFNRFTA